MPFSAESTFANFLADAFAIFVFILWFWLFITAASDLFRRNDVSGFGKVLGLFLSLILLQIISTGFNLLGFSPHLTQAIWGATMILAIAIALVRDRWIANLWLRKASK